MQSGFHPLRPSARLNYSVERLEPRRLLSAAIAQAIAPVTVQQGATATVDLTQNFTDSSLTGTLVEFDTSGGSVEVELSDAATPITVANFLSYVDQGLYNGTIIHRSVSNFIVQGGGYTTDGTPIPTAAPIMNEFGQSNVEGTIAMAKLGDDPNSATSQWFFNVANNSQNLDNQNGGFTVFGKVISGFSLIQQINQLPTTSATIGVSSFTDLPVVNLATGATPTADNLVTVNQVFVAPKDTFTATSDVPGLVNPVVSSMGVMTLNASPDASGYAHITVTATGIDGGSSVTNTFRVHVEATAGRTLDVNLGGSAPGTINFQMGPRDDGRVSLNGPGTAVLEFTGDNLALSGGSVTGSNIQLDAINASGTTSASSLAILGTNFKSSFATVGDITTTGSLNTIAITRGILEGDLTVAGSLKDIRIAEAENGSINVGASSGGTALSILLPRFADENLVSSEPIALIKPITWNNSDSASEVVQAPSIRRIDALENFEPGIQVTAGGSTGLGSILVRGFVGGAWSIPGRLPSLKVGGTAPDFNATFTQPLGALRFAQGMQGSLTVPSITSLFVRGNIDQATLTLTGAFDARKSDLGSLTVTGSILTSSIISAGNIGPVTAIRCISSTIFAGVGTLPQGQSLPEAPADFASPARITSLTTQPGSTVGFLASFVAAETIGNVNLNRLQSKFSTSFGFAAQSIGSITGTDTLTPQTFALHNLDSAATLATEVTAQNLTLNQIVINLV